MEFSIEFYRTVSGKCPLAEFLRELKASDPDDYRSVLTGFEKLKHRPYHKPPLCKALGDGLLELRHVGKLNTRVLWFFMSGSRIVAVHGIRHKAQVIPVSDLQVAKQRRDDWLRRVG